MKCRWIFVLALAVPGAALAQKQNPFEQQVRTVDLQSTSTARQTAMYEDIEIMRRILDKALNLPRYSTPGYPNLPWTAFNATPNLFNYDNTTSALPGAINNTITYPLADVKGTVQANYPQINPYIGLSANNQLQYWPPNQQGHSYAQLPGVQGVYLPGYGVVFTATLPPGPVTLTSGTGAEPAKPVSEWDRVRRQVRGEKPRPVQAKHKPQHPTLADVILKMLAENGHHFRQLGENEKLTVVVTLEPVLENNNGSPWLNTYFRATQTSPQPNMKPEQPTSKPHREVNFANRPSADVSGKSVNEYELLGRLQMEQGHDQQAIHALAKAAEATKDRRHAAELYLKIAGLCLSAGVDEKQARDMANKATRLLQEVAAAAPSAKNPAPQAATPKPSKLIITATRKQLEDVAAGRLDFEAFKRAAAVQTITIPTAESNR